MRDAFFNSLLAEARKDESIVVLSGDHGAFPLEQFAEELPDQYFNVGIAEQNMISVAAGLAKVGRTPFVYGIAPFLGLRALEQITLDVCANGVAVNIVSVGAGFTYSTDGPTHHGLQDLAVVSSIPGITLLNSSDPANTADFVLQALATQKPHYIRIEKEKIGNLVRSEPFEIAMALGFSLLASRGPSQTVILSTGIMARVALEAAEILWANLGKIVDVVDLHRIAPFPEELIHLLARYDSVYVVEDSYQSVIAREVAIRGAQQAKALPLRGVADAGASFFFHGDSRHKLHDSAGLSGVAVGEMIRAKEDW
jgi:transketolase